MTSLLQRLSLESRLISENDLIDLKGSMLTPIDYGTVSQKLNAEIERSFAWLKHALYADIGSKALSEYNILDQRMDEEISKLRRAGFSTHERKSKLLLQRGIRCLKENGMKYTIKRFFEKVQHKLIGRPRAE